MEKFQEFGGLAREKLQLAEHILAITYPMVKDARLPLAVAENLFLSLTYAMSSVLYYERLFNRIPPFQENFAAKFHLFEKKCIGKHGISREHIRLIQEVRDIVMQHKKSPVEFQRKGQFVICDEYFSIRVISADFLEDYVSKAKSFIDGILTTVSRDESVLA